MIISSYDSRGKNEKRCDAKQTIIKFENGHLYTASDSCITEMPLTIKVNEFKFATIICSRNYLEELTLGFLASEGIFLREMTYNPFISTKVKDSLM